MNWKTNYWTLLFVLAVCGAIYLQFFSDSNSHTNSGQTGGPSELPNEIDSTQAAAEMLAWDTLRAEFIVAINNSQDLTGDAKYVAKGFNIPTVDMLDIIETIKSGTNVLGMLAIRDTAITMIFQVIDQHEKMRYYDFTKPCPNYCDN